MIFHLHSKNYQFNNDTQETIKNKLNELFNKYEITDPNNKVDVEIEYLKEKLFQIKVHIAISKFHLHSFTANSSNITLLGATIDVLHKLDSQITHYIDSKHKNHKR